MEFSLLSEEETLLIANIPIKNEQDLEHPLFGTISNDMKCIKCGLYDYCPGHCGRLELDRYIVNPLFEKDLNTIINTHCHTCGAKRTTKRCIECNSVSAMNFKYQFTTLDMRNETAVLDETEILNILARIDPYAKNLMTKYIIIPPTRIRSYTPEYPDLSRLSKLYLRLIAAPSYTSIKSIIGSQRKSLLYDFISGKNGIFRNTSLGKRINRSGRAVIAPDPFLPVNTIALPEKIWNVMKIDANDRRLTKTVCINRQPSLSKYSIMSFKAVSHNISDVIFINPCVTPAFNADFDGDEMNVFFLDHPSSREEMSDLIFVDNNMISYQNDRPIIYPVQDVITGCYMMTAHPVEVTEREMSEAAMLCGIVENRNYPRTTLGLLSMTLPHDFSYNHDDILVINGQFVSGMLRKKELLRMLRFVNLLSHVETVMQRVVCHWVFSQGLSATLSDCSDTSEKNNILTMINSGSKGNVRNYISITQHVGEQYVKGKNIGYCESSYFKGLSPDEYFTHQMAAREGVVNTGVSTSGAGYLSRRGCKKISETIVSYEGTVINNDKIISFHV